MYAKLVFDSRKEVKAYCDADWAYDKGESRSVGGYVILMLGASVAWRSKKQNVIATSKLEAEYISMYEVSREVEWLKMFVNEVSGERIVQKPCTINVDRGKKLRIRRNILGSNITNLVNLSKKAFLNLIMYPLVKMLLMHLQRT
jgi:hypothetical protein